MYPLVVPVFNNPTYLKNFYKQVKDLPFSRIEIYDNGSTYPPMVQLLKDLEKEPKVKVIILEKNAGPHYVLRTPELYEAMEEVFCLSDPDIEFSKNLPSDFLDNLMSLTDEYHIGKVGFAISIPEEIQLPVHIRQDEKKVEKFINDQKSLWENKIGSTEEGDDYYLSSIDTTFALYNKKYFDPLDRYRSIRVAGRYTSTHYGYIDHQIVPLEEEEFYRSTSRYSYSKGFVDGQGNPIISISVLEYTKLIEKVDDLDLRLLEVTKSRDKLLEELETLYNSHSWKITKLLRIIKRVFKYDK